MVVVHVARRNEPRLAASLRGSDVGEFGVAFAVRDRNGNDRSFHAAKEHARVFVDSERGKAGLEAFGFVLYKSRPEFGAGDERLEVAHHLTAIAHAESECILSRKERGKLRARPFVEQHALGPTFTGA